MSLYFISINATKRNKSHKLLNIKQNYASIDMCEPHPKESSRDQYDGRFSYSRRYCQNPQDVRGNCKKTATQKAVAWIQNRWNLENRTGRSDEVSCTAEKYSGSINLKAAFSRRQLKSLEAVHILPTAWKTLGKMLGLRYLFCHYTWTRVPKAMVLCNWLGGGWRCML